MLKQMNKAAKLNSEGRSIRQIADIMEVTTYRVRTWLDAAAQVVPPKGDGPHVLIYDIETAPTLGYVWQLWDARVLSTEAEWFVLCFAYKWLGEDETHFVSIRHDPLYHPGYEDDSFVIQKIHDLMTMADGVIAHNGNKFDNKAVQARMFIHNMAPPSYYAQIDTLLEARRYFKLNSNALQALGKVLKLGQKVQHTGFALWKGCLMGQEAEWQVMEEYNLQDVDLLERVYFRLLPWMNSPGKPMSINAALWAEGEMICTRAGCGGREFTKDGFYFTKTGKYQSYRCKECRGKNRDRKRESQKETGGAYFA